MLSAGLSIFAEHHHVPLDRPHLVKLILQKHGILYRENSLGQAYFLNKEYLELGEPSPATTFRFAKAGRRHVLTNFQPQPAFPHFSNGFAEFEEVPEDALASAVVDVNGKVLFLTPLEYALLRHFVLHKDRMVSEQELRRYFWTPQLNSNSPRVYINSLRNKLKLRDEDKNRYILSTTHRVGYRFRES